MTKQHKDKLADTSEAVQGPIAPIIYADRVLNIGFGAAVSRFTLGMELGANTFMPCATVIMPTPSFLEGLDAMVKAAHGNEVMKKTLIETLDTYRDQLSKL